MNAVESPGTQYLTFQDKAMIVQIMKPSPDQQHRRKKNQVMLTMCLSAFLLTVVFSVSVNRLLLAAVLVGSSMFLLRRHQQDLNNAAFHAYALDAVNGIMLDDEEEKEKGGSSLEDEETNITSNACSSSARLTSASFTADGEMRRLDPAELDKENDAVDDQCPLSLLKSVPQDVADTIERLREIIQSTPSDDISPETRDWIDECARTVQHIQSSSS